MGQAGAGRLNVRWARYQAIDYVMALKPPPPGGVDDPFLAEILHTAPDFASRGWALCPGQTLPIDASQALFELIGTTFGGDRRTTLSLPDMRGRLTVASGEVGHQGQLATGSGDSVAYLPLNAMIALDAILPSISDRTRRPPPARTQPLTPHPRTPPRDTRSAPGSGRQAGP